jgi:prevent-host-death family protein
MAIRAKTSAKPKPQRATKRTKEYLVDVEGRRVAVVLPIREYERLVERIEDLEDLRAVREALEEGGEPIPWEVVKAELQAKGKLP